jgi:hypothetical protein
LSAYDVIGARRSDVVDNNNNNNNNNNNVDKRLVKATPLVLASR